MTDPDAALAAIRRRINAGTLTDNDARAMYDALTELAGVHQQMGDWRYCDCCGELWPCTEREILETALGDVTA